MSAQQALSTLSENIRQVAIGLSGGLQTVRMHEKGGVFRFTGFSGSAVVDLAGDGLTVLEPQSEAVVYSTLLDASGNDERAVRIAGRVCDEMLTVYRQQFMV